MEFLKFVRSLGLVPVLAVKDASKAEGLGKALVEGGLPIAEVTLRTESALDVIKSMSSVEGLVTGAGTVTNAEEAEQVIDAGAEFIVSPALDKGVSDVCKARNIPYIPGVASPRDIQDAMNMGHKTVKFFPAEAFGGVKTLKALAAPYGGITFMPTGGINVNNLESYLEQPFVEACGGSWLVDKNALAAGDWPTIIKTLKEGVALVNQIRNK
ncbi:MAG: bifunctional 4-hydroxy-2-oxoglutarate aldolase/2-dehydro-3-deoxy-phosphogluconate aldolase [Lentisphaeraceae bacterium]|nr:bifunctional 4-hydroxy-2-oxoglutarate aldolase/2-dehydro-3-deoxy-phosphogluconate aldolase [Lentisphaeraceae bacterium]